MAQSATPTRELIEVFCRYIVKKGKVIYPKRAKCFHFFIKRKR